MNEIHLKTIDSTNTYAKKHAPTFPKGQITCVIAEEQTAGRGRFHRTWDSPKGGNLYATFYFLLPASSKSLMSLSQIMACSMAKVLLTEHFSPKIKWPNDIQLSGKKCSGILCETRFQGEEVEIFLGIGLNVNMGQDLLGNIDQPATSLFVESGKEWNQLEILQKLQTQFASDLALFTKKGFAPFHNFFDKLLLFKGEKIRCFDGKKEWTGLFHSITSDGQLNLPLPDGSMHTMLSGDISHD